MCIHAYAEKDYLADNVVSEIGTTILSRVILTDMADYSVLGEIVDKVISSQCILHNKQQCTHCEPWFSIYRITDTQTPRISMVGGYMEKLLQDVHVPCDIVYNYLMYKEDEIINIMHSSP